MRFWAENGEGKTTAKTTAIESVASPFGLRSGVTPQRARALVGDRVFGRTVAPLCGLARRGAEAPLYLKSNDGVRATAIRKRQGDSRTTKDNSNGSGNLDGNGNNRNRNSNSRSPSGMTTRKATATATAGARTPATLAATRTSTAGHWDDNQNGMATAKDVSHFSQDDVLRVMLGQVVSSFARLGC